MKKALIAGAASLAIAAMPVAGVFAVKSTDSAIDELIININPTCTITTTAHTPDSGVWTGNTLTQTIAADTAVDLGTSTFKVVCNDTTGWSVAATAQPLVGQSTGHTSEQFTVGDTATASGVYSYAASTTETDGATAASAINAATVFTGTKETGAGKSFTISYKAKADSTTQSAQQYKGTVTYTLSSAADVTE